MHPLVRADDRIDRADVQALAAPDAARFIDDRTSARLMPAVPGI
jgi:hypothetical protein